MTLALGLGGMRFAYYETTKKKGLRLYGNIGGMGLKEVLGDIKKAHGLDIGTLGSSISMVERFGTGVSSLDHVLGGGIPVGRVVEVYGENSSGKTLISLYCIAERQRAGVTCAFIDMEHAFDTEFAKMVGVDTDKLLFVQPDSGEQGWDIAIKLAGSEEVGFIVVDSVAAMLPMREVDGDVGDSHVGLHARMMAQGLRKVTPIAAKSRCSIMFINQTRSNIGGYGSSLTTTGGKSLPFFASQRRHISRTGWEYESKKEEKIKGYNMKIKIVKNKTGTPLKVTRLYVEWGEGIDLHNDVVLLAVELGVIEKSGSRLSYGECKYQGSHKMAQGLMDAGKYDEVVEKLKQCS